MRKRQPVARRTFSVTHYDVQLEPRLESRTVTATLVVVVHRDDVETIALNRGRLEIDGVLEKGRARAFVVDGNLQIYTVFSTSQWISPSTNRARGRRCACA